MTRDHESLVGVTDPRGQKLDRDVVRRWRSEAITAPAQDRLWLNRCEALCTALLDAQAKIEALKAPKCACRSYCGDVPESEDGPRAICKGLPS